MSYYRMAIDGKPVIDRLLQQPRSNAVADLILDANLIGNVLKLYAEHDPAACYREWGPSGHGVLKKGVRQGGTLTIDGTPYDFAVEDIPGRASERCYHPGQGKGREPFWVLAPAGRPNEWLVVDTLRRRRHLKRIIDMCTSGFFKKYGIQHIDLLKVIP